MRNAPPFLRYALRSAQKLHSSSARTKPPHTIGSLPRCLAKLNQCSSFYYVRQTIFFICRARVWWFGKASYYKRSFPVVSRSGSLKFYAVNNFGVLESVQNLDCQFANFAIFVMLYAILSYIKIFGRVLLAIFIILSIFCVSYYLPLLVPFRIQMQTAFINS